MTKFTDVLLVEDDPITIMVCDRIIKMTKFSEKVTSCENGKVALDYLVNIMHTGEISKNYFFRHQYARNERVGFFRRARRNKSKFQPASAYLFAFIYCRPRRLQKGQTFFAGRKLYF